MLPEDHFLSLAVREAMKPLGSCKVDRFGWEPSGRDPFGLDEPPLTKEPKPAAESDREAATSDESSEWDARLLRQRMQGSSSDEEATEGASSNNVQGGATPGSSESFSVVLAQLHFILSILSEDDSFFRLPPLSTIHTCPLIGSGHSFVLRRASKAEIPELGDLPGQSGGSGRDSGSNDGNEPPRYYAIKTANVSRAEDATARMRDVLREVQILTHAPLRAHPNIVRLLGFAWERLRIDITSRVTRWPCLVLEYSEYGSMVDVFEQHVVGFETRIDLCLDVGHGLAALHDADVVHGDVKMENVLVFPVGDRLTAKISDFGFASVDLDGSQPSVPFHMGTRPWRAPEVGKTLSRAELFLTDVYSYGLLIWRTIAYGHTPFVEADGKPSEEVMDQIEKNGQVGGVIFDMAAAHSLGYLLPETHFVPVFFALQASICKEPSNRSLARTIEFLRCGRPPFSPSAATIPLRTLTIPQEQGLGIYTYGCYDNRLDFQMMLALVGFCQSKQSMEGSLSFFRPHCASTLSAWHLDEWSNILDDGSGIKERCRELSWQELCESAYADSDTSAEQLYSQFHILWPSGKTIPGELLPMLAGRALRRGMEFILREVLENDTPGKAAFLELFTTRLCRGAGIVAGPADAGIPLPDDAALFKTIADGKPAEDIFRLAATWGRLGTAQAVLARYPSLNIQATDMNGETALLRACRGGHYDLAFWLLKTLKASAAQKTQLAVTPLHWIHAFTGPRALKLAKLLKKNGGDPNAIAINGSNKPEAQFWFFKGPPLIRAVAAGNEDAVRALLEIGADPTVPIKAGSENAIQFAARRLRAAILAMLLAKVPDYPVHALDGLGRTLLSCVINCHITYAAKIHGKRHEEAQRETFDVVWNLKRKRKGLFHRWWVKTPVQRFFQSINASGMIPIQVAVKAGSMLIARAIINRAAETAAVIGESLARQLQLSIASAGLQSAVLYEKAEMVRFFLSLGASPLDPAYSVDPGKAFQDPPVLFSAEDIRCHWLGHTTALHTCARAGDSSTVIGKLLLERLKPKYTESLSNYQLEARKRAAVEFTHGEQSYGGGDLLLNVRDEYDCTPFYSALENEEYMYASQLLEYGANKNALIEDTSIAEHALAWSPVKALTAVKFLVRGTWGNLRISRRGYLDGVIARTASWPRAQAADMFNDVLGFVAPRPHTETAIYRGQYRVMRLDGGPTHCGCALDWDRHICRAVEALNAPALEELVRRRPTGEKPLDGYSPVNALRRVLLGMEVPDTLEERKERFRAWKVAADMLPTLQHGYPDHRYDTSLILMNIAGDIIQQVEPELSIASARFCAGATSVTAFAVQVRRLLAPFLFVAAGCSDSEMRSLERRIGRFIPPQAKLECSVTRKKPAKEGLDLEWTCEDPDLRVRWPAAPKTGLLQAGCYCWK